MTKAIAGLVTVGSGSYAAEDVQFLLQAVQMETTDVLEIGRAHV